MLGTAAKNHEVYATYIESKKPKAETDEESPNVDDLEEKGWTGFLHDEHGLYIMSYMIVGYLKHAGNLFKDQFGIKALRAKIADLVVVTPRRIHLGKMAPDGVIERPLRAMTAQGPRVTVARSDYVAAGTELEFDLGIYPNKEVTWPVIAELFTYGSAHGGLGQFRGGGYGTFELVEPTNA